MRHIIEAIVASPALGKADRPYTWWPWHLTDNYGFRNCTHCGAIEALCLCKPDGQLPDIKLGIERDPMLARNDINLFEEHWVSLLKMSYEQNLPPLKLCYPMPCP